MCSVTGGTVRHAGISRLGLETVVAVDERGQSPQWKAVLLVQDDGFMAGRAGGLRDPGPRDRRSRIIVSQDSVLSVAGRAYRGIRFAARHELSMDPFQIIALLPLMALPARFRNIEVIDRGFRIPGREDLV